MAVMRGLISRKNLGWLLVLLAVTGCSTSAASSLSPLATPAMLAAKTPGRAQTATPTPTNIATPTTTPTPSRTPTPTITPTPTNTATPTPTPTPTLDLASCNLAGCGDQAKPLPTLEYDTDMLLTFDPPQRRACDECPKNEVMSEAELDALVSVDANTLAQLEKIALSQTPYVIAPGVVYIVSDNMHHVVIDLKEAGLVLRNIVPPIPDVETRENVRITPSYCFRPETLVVTTGDYHGLVGSNKTETGRELFFHLGRAALFKLDGEYDIRVIRKHSEFARTDVSWGAGPLFIWDGVYDFNPEQEWFEEEALDYYRTNKWGKLSVAISKDRKYLFLSTSYGKTLRQHANNIIELGQKWGIQVDRAMRFDSTENTYLAIRMGDTMVPVMNIEEPLIVNCFAVEKKK